MMNAFMTFASQILLAAEDGDHGGEELVPGITSGPIVEWAWLIVVVPLVAAFVIVLFGKK